MGSGAHRVDSDLDITVGAVLEPNGTRKTRYQFPMYLTLRSPGANRCPTDQVAHILRGEQAQKLRSRRNPHIIHVAQQAAGQAQTRIDSEAAIQVRVVDKSLPT
jgi:hypothetical protein